MFSGIVVFVKVGCGLEEDWFKVFLFVGSWDEVFNVGWDVGCEEVVEVYVGSEGSLYFGLECGFF